MKYIYMAVRNRKNGKPTPSFGISDDPGEVARNLSEQDELKNHHIGKFTFTQVGLILNKDMGDYWYEDEE